MKFFANDMEEICASLSSMNASVQLRVANVGPRYHIIQERDKKFDVWTLALKLNPILESMYSETCSFSKVWTNSIGNYKPGMGARDGSGFRVPGQNPEFF